jgi:hypothetical protein
MFVVDPITITTYSMEDVIIYVIDLITTTTNHIE